MEKIAEQIETLTTAFLRGVHRLGIAVKTPADSVGPLVVLQSRDAMQTVEKLSRRRIVVSPRLDGVRFAFHFYNTMDEVEQTLEALKDHLDLFVRA